MQGDDVRALEELVELHGFRAMAAHFGAVDAWIRREDGKAEAPHAPADGLADSAEADNAEREAGEAPQSAHLVPAPVVRALYLAVVGAQAALARQDQCERVVRDLVRAVLADRRDADAARGGGRDVHAVPAGRRHRDDAAALEPAERWRRRRARNP